MKSFLKNELWLINILSVFLILIITFLSIPFLRIVLGLPFLLFLPGYVWITALFPRKEQLDIQERLLFSVGLSLVLIPLVSLLLNITSWGIRLYPILISLSLLIFIGSVVSWLRRRNITVEARAGWSGHFDLSRWMKSSRLTRVLTIVLICVVLGAIGVISYYIANPKVSETFTQFYILGSQATTDRYPRDVQIGKTFQVTVGVINEEKINTTYGVEIRIDGVVSNETKAFSLKQGQKWEQPVDITPTKTGSDQSVEFYLYKNGELDTNLQPLRLLINVTP